MTKATEPVQTRIFLRLYRRKSHIKFYGHKIKGSHWRVYQITQCGPQIVRLLQSPDAAPVGQTSSHSACSLGVVEARGLGSLENHSRNLPTGHEDVR